MKIVPFMQLADSQAMFYDINSAKVVTSIDFKSYKMLNTDFN